MAEQTYIKILDPVNCSKIPWEFRDILYSSIVPPANDSATTAETMTSRTLCLGFVPKNVQLSWWCVWLYWSCGQTRNWPFPKNKYSVPTDIVLTDDLVRWSCHFDLKSCKPVLLVLHVRTYMEVHKINGEPYLPKTPQHPVEYLEPGKEPDQPIRS